MIAKPLNMSSAVYLVPFSNLLGLIGRIKSFILKYTSVISDACYSSNARKLEFICFECHILVSFFDIEAPSSVANLSHCQLPLEADWFKTNGIWSVSGSWCPSHSCSTPLGGI